MTWETYYDRFYDWEESTQMRHLSSLTDFGPSSEVTELAGAFFEQKSADRLIKKALAGGVRFRTEDVLDLDGVVDQSLMPQLIKTIPRLSAEELDELSTWLSKEDFLDLAQRNNIRVDEYGYAVLPEIEALEAEAREEERLAQEEAEQLQAEIEAMEAETIQIAKIIYPIRSSNRRERRKKRREAKAD